MEQAVIDMILKNKALVGAARRISPGKTVKLAGVWGSSSPMIAAAIGRLGNAPILFITPHIDQADEVADDVEVLRSRPAQLFPAWEVDLSVTQDGARHVNDEVTGERLRICNLLTSTDVGHIGKIIEPVDFIVAPVMAMLQPVPTPDSLESMRLRLTKDQALSPDALAGWLVDAGFESVEQVDQQGDFARRGGILDIFPLGSPEALRVEFFGDQIDSIRKFDLDNQRSTDEISMYDLTGYSAGRGSGMMTSLLSYLPANTIICMSQPSEVMEVAREIFRRTNETSGASGLLDPDDVFVGMGKYALLEMHTFRPADEGGNIQMGIRSLEKLSLNIPETLTELEELAHTASVRVYCENPAEEKRFREVIAETHGYLAANVHTAIGHINGGFYWPTQRLVIVGHHEIFHRYSKVRRIRRIRAGRPIESLLDLTDGDYVVHVAHGIAKFEGLRMMERDGRSEEYLALRFADSAMLHVPAGSINLVQKYIGTPSRRPTLSKLGGAGWAKQKERVTEAVQDLAAEMLRVQAMRQSMQGVSYPADTELQHQFTGEFIYSETEDQITSMRQIDSDMAAQRPMDRLLCGDVGYGKTELAMRAAFKVAEAGKQVAVLVPTTVLAAQHYRTFSERFADYPIRVDHISRFRTAGQQQKIIKELAAGQIDILIGTHRLLSKDVKFADLGMVVIDEEQRFGVENKEHLKSMRASVDVLTMTATPIPRTLHMSLLGLRDISSLSTPPMDRRAIHTEVVQYDENFLRQVIVRELNRQGQVFFVHNRVMDIDALGARLKALVPDARIAVGHGQMAEGELEKVMLRFVRQEVDVLLCTTIIESGLDIPTANTIIIHNADRFGLAELHQLRGRVGRYKHRAFCYLILPQGKPVSPAAAKRLKAIEEFSDLGAGFQIAMRDLEIRGAGNILGKEQSGYIATVGYELYCQLLEQSVRQLQGQREPIRQTAHVELGIDAYIPTSYVPAERQRMEIYRRLVKCASREELAQLQADLADAYGEVPPLMQMLLDLTEVRVLASVLGIDSIIRMDPDIIFKVRDFSRIRTAFDQSIGSMRLIDAKTAYWRPPPVYMEAPTLVTVLTKRLRKAAGDGKNSSQ